MCIDPNVMDDSLEVFIETVSEKGFLFFLAVFVDSLLCIKSVYLSDEGKWVFLGGSH